jgi:hypothetical protein
MQGLPPEESQRRQNLFAVFPLAVLRVMKEGRGKEFGVSGRVPMLAVSQKSLPPSRDANRQMAAANSKPPGRSTRRASARARSRSLWFVRWYSGPNSTTVKKGLPETVWRERRLFARRYHKEESLLHRACTLKS